MRSADLHLHTYFSDGTFSPEELVARAREAQLACISVTDHDSVQGIDRARRAAATDIEVLTGIELTAEAAGQEIHILGYLFDPADAVFLKMLEGMREVRVRRVFEICEKLKKLGVALAAEKVLAMAGSGSVGRLHVARALLQEGAVGSIQEAFARFIGDRGAAYVGKFKMTPRQAIDHLLRVKGVPVLAHPYTLGDRSLIADFVKAGIMGIEAFYAEHSDYQTQEYIKIAEKFGLVVTGGSDCHGQAKEKVLLGLVKVPYSYVEKLKEVQCRI